MVGIRILYDARRLAFVALLIALASFVVPMAMADSIRLRLGEPRMVCESSQSYCEVAVQVAYAYPPRSSHGSEIALQCVAEIAVGSGPGTEREIIRRYAGATRAPVTFDAVDEEVRVPLRPPAGTGAVRIRNIACRADT